jgi:hypothetical protein
LVKWDEDGDLVRKVDQLFPCYLLYSRDEEETKWHYLGPLKKFSHVISPILHPMVGKS